MRLSFLTLQRGNVPWVDAPRHKSAPR
ncbi:DUF1534 domain-containing protein, partial [Pseudomonas syringae pv. actinidiae]|nr:DUF1534 domain-containing protein [Pseudomonas syringae pv. actinidiae]